MNEDIYIVWCNPFSKPVYCFDLAHCFLALLEYVDCVSRVTCTVVQVSGIHLAIHPLIQFFEKPLHGSSQNFMKSHESTLSPNCIINFSKFIIFNMGPLRELKFQKCYFSHSFDSISTKLCDKYMYVSHGGI